MTMTIGGTSGLVFPDSSTQNTAATGFGFKNRIINGAMMIDQRNAGATGTSAGYNIDRWGYSASQSSKFTWGQNLNSVTPPVGFTKYLGFQSSSAYSIGSTDYFEILQPVEGLNVADLAWGTANAKTVTLSFQVYSSLTGTFGGSITNSGTTRSYPFSYSIPVANTWTSISVTIPGDTTGTWLTTNGVGLTVRFSLGMGSTYSNTAGSWYAGDYESATGATSVVGTNGATFYITGVQLEKGSTATSFDYRPYGTELALCQRYYELQSARTYITYTAGGVDSILYGSWCVAKRTSPTLTVSSAVNINTATAGPADSGTKSWYAGLVSGGTSNAYAYATITASAEL